MIISKRKPDHGICFAWTPKWTPEGAVWLEWVHYQRTDDAYDLHPWRYSRATFDRDGVHYARWMPQARYDAGERAQAQFYSKPGDTFATPPDISKCGKLRTDGPTPCHYPHCTCMTVGGDVCPEGAEHFGMLARKGGPDA